MNPDLPTDPLAANKACELHVHVGGCFSAEDIVELATPYYDAIDWSVFVDAYDAAFGLRPDPADWFRRAASGDLDLLATVRQHFVFTEADGPDFARFQARFNLLIAVFRHYLRHVPAGEYIGPRRALAHHRDRGVRYVELRANYMKTDDPEGYLHFHRVNAESCRDECIDGFEARYVPSLPREAPGPAYDLLQNWLDGDGHHLRPWIPGVDFCAVEEGFPPRGAQAVVRRILDDGAADPDRALEVLYHVGEIYFDKSLESAVRWCHEAAAMGARRLGHCTALGLDPAAAAARRGGSHTEELVSERLDQIDYDLQHRKGLEDAGIDIDGAALTAEREQLRSLAPDASVERSYDENRLEQIRRRQTFALQQITQQGTVIESCPSSNMRLGSVPSADLHPVHRFIESDVDLVIGADDPGIFDSPLRAEVDWVVDTTHLTPEALAQRLGDPLRHRLRNGDPL